MTTDGLTTTESLSSAAITGSLTSISSHFAVILRPPASDAVGDSILAITNLPSLSVEQTATSSNSSAYCDLLWCYWVSRFDFVGRTFVG